MSVITLEVSEEDARDMEAAAKLVGLPTAEWILSLTEGPLRNFRQCRERDNKPRRRRPREND